MQRRVIGANKKDRPASPRRSFSLLGVDAYRMWQSGGLDLCGMCQSGAQL
jgi:hypothetical protein